ncbi:MAG: sulfotransferase [Planctomycetaceae bacterium]
MQESVGFLRSQPDSRGAVDVSCPSPVFVLSAGWRSGSTLLQRLLCSGHQTLLWGEPFGDRIPAVRLALTLHEFQPDDAHLNYSIDQFSGDLSKQWVANLNPGVEVLRPAHLAFFETLLAEPAKRAGATRWGAKWVRLTGDHAAYLKWLYPDARILFLVRHPLHAYLSYKGKRWYTVRPHHQVNSVLRFMAHWRYLAESFIAHRDALGAMLVRYEDLTPESSVIDQIEEFVDTPIRRDVLAERVGERDKQGRRISRWDRAVYRFLAGSVAKSVGYGPRGEIDLDFTLPGPTLRQDVPHPSSTESRLATQGMVR